MGLVSKRTPKRRRDGNGPTGAARLRRVALEGRVVRGARWRSSGCQLPSASPGRLDLNDLASLCLFLHQSWATAAAGTAAALAARPWTRRCVCGRWTGWLRWCSAACRGGRSARRRAERAEAQRPPPPRPRWVRMDGGCLGEGCLGCGAWVMVGAWVPACCLGRDGSRWWMKGEGACPSLHTRSFASPGNSLPCPALP